MQFLSLREVTVGLCPWFTLTAGSRGWDIPNPPPSASLKPQMSGRTRQSVSAGAASSAHLVQIVVECPRKSKEDQVENSELCWDGN